MHKAALEASWPLLCRSGDLAQVEEAAWRETEIFKEKLEPERNKRLVSSILASDLARKLHKREEEVERYLPAFLYSEGSNWGRQFKLDLQ